MDDFDTVKQFNRCSDALIFTAIPIDKLMKEMEYSFGPYGDIYHSFDFYYFICAVNESMHNILYLRSKDPKNNGVGFIFLHEVYHMLWLKYDGDQNIGITKPGEEWHDISKEIKQ